MGKVSNKFFILTLLIFIYTFPRKVIYKGNKIEIIILNGVNI